MLMGLSIGKQDVAILKSGSEVQTHGGFKYFHILLNFYWAIILSFNC